MKTRRPVPLKLALCLRVVKKEDLTPPTTVSKIGKEIDKTFKENVED
jgi:hypothetical protein